MYDGMNGLAAAVYEAGNRQLQLLICCQLLLNGEHIRFDQRVSESSHVAVGCSFTVQGIKANPRTNVRFPIADGRPEVIRVLGKRCQQFSSGTAEHSTQRLPASVIGLAHVSGDVPDILVLLIQSADILYQFLSRLHGRRGRVCASFSAVVGNGIVPVHSTCALEGLPAAQLGQLHNRRTGNRCAASVKGVPLAGTFAGMIAIIIVAPIVPHGAGIALMLKSHADIHPFLIAEIAHVQCGQRGQKQIVHTNISLTGHIGCGIEAVRQLPVERRQPGNNA